MKVNANRNRLVGKLFTALVVSAICGFVSFQARGALTPSSWAFGSGGPTTYSADTVGTGLSSAGLVVASPNGGTIIRQTTGGNTGGYHSIAGSPPTKVGGSTLTFTLTRTAATSFSLTTLTFDYNLIGNKPPGSITWTYNVGAGNVSLASSSLNQVAGWQTTGSVDLSGVSGFGPSGTITIVGTIVNNQSGNGNNGDIGFDNFAIAAVPEPVNLALALIGVCVVGVGVSRRVYVWARA